MKHRLLLLCALLALSACGPKTKTPPPMESPKDVLVHQLFALTESGQIAYGHQDDLVYGHSWVVDDPENDPIDRSDVKAVTGAFPMVVGFDLGGIELGEPANLDGVPFDLMRRAALAHIARGGIVTFSWHPRNPLTGGDAWDISSDEVVTAVLDGGEKHAEFVQWLSRAADFIASLGDVAVIFRPWHENTGSWFWWGEALCGANEYKELFRFTWRYFTETRGLTNILWCYSPGGDAGAERTMARYPGDEVVDLFGMDSYMFVGDGSVEQARDRYQNELKGALRFLTEAGDAHRKLICLSETGLEGLTDPHWWTEVLLPAIEDFPICYVLTWRNAHDKPGHFYAPWPGFEGEDDFRSFCDSEKIVLLKQE